MLQLVKTSLGGDSIFAIVLGIVMITGVIILDKHRASKKLKGKLSYEEMRELFTDEDQEA